jgi:hypothetical protein
VSLLEALEGLACSVFCRVWLLLLSFPVGLCSCAASAASAVFCVGLCCWVGSAPFEASLVAWGRLSYPSLSIILFVWCLSVGCDFFFSVCPTVVSAAFGSTSSLFFIAVYWVSFPLPYRLQQLYSLRVPLIFLLYLLSCQFFPFLYATRNAMYTMLSTACKL